MSDARPEPGTVRPGGRTAKVREAVMRAAGDALAEDGFDRLDLAEIARRAGVGKTTVYRRWGTVPGLVADLLGEMAADSLPRTETGSLFGDLTGAGPPRAVHIERCAAGSAVQGAHHRGQLRRGDGGRAASFLPRRTDEWAPCVTAGNTARGDPGGDGCRRSDSRRLRAAVLPIPRQRRPDRPCRAPTAPPAPRQRPREPGRSPIERCAVFRDADIDVKIQRNAWSHHRERKDQSTEMSSTGVDRPATLRTPTVNEFGQVNSR